MQPGRSTTFLPSLLPISSMPVFPLLVSLSASDPGVQSTISGVVPRGSGFPPAASGVLICNSAVVQPTPPGVPNSALRF